MLGSAQGQPPTQPLNFGGVKVSPEKFEGWVRDQLSRRRIVGGAPSSADFLPAVAAAQPGQFQAAVFGRPNDSAKPGFNGGELPYESRDLEWTWRRLTVLGEDSVLAVERARITSFDLAGGKVRWDFPSATVWRPAACGRWSAGKESTSAPPWPGTAPAWFAWMAKRAATCGSAIAAARSPAIRLPTADASSCSPSGRPTSSSLRRCASWNSFPKPAASSPAGRSWRPPRPRCPPANARPPGPATDWFVLIAGNVICTDLQGRIIWLRQETTIPNAIDPAFVQQHCRPAIDSDGWLFVAQPGSSAGRLPRPGDRPAPLAARHRRLAKHRRSAGQPPPGADDAGIGCLEQDDGRSPLAMRVAGHAVGLRPRDIRPGPCCPAGDHRRQAATRIPRDRSGHGTNAGPRCRAAGKEPASPFRTDHGSRRRDRR